MQTIIGAHRVMILIGLMWIPSAITLMGQSKIKAYDRLAYRVVEHAADGVHLVPVGVRVPLDIGSDVALEMKPLASGEPAPEGEGWQVFTAPDGVAYEVTVQAFLDDLDGDRTVMHVAGYDTLPLGKLSDIFSRSVQSAAGASGTGPHALGSWPSRHAGIASASGRRGKLTNSGDDLADGGRAVGTA